MVFLIIGQRSPPVYAETKFSVVHPPADKGRTSAGRKAAITIVARGIITRTDSTSMAITGANTRGSRSACTDRRAKAGFFTISA